MNRQNTGCETILYGFQNDDHLILEMLDRSKKMDKSYSRKKVLIKRNLFTIDIDFSLLILS